MDRATPNRLAGETSPYLQQHAANPVEWYPWGEEALTRAREQDKPILLSIGYSACHWCHVMAHESFEDEETAALMNELFVNIKVDREERPDLDKIYQLAHAALTRRNGGWPLTMFLAPGDQVPFFGGTYFPNAPRHGLPGFKDVLRRVAGFYRSNRSDVGQQCAAMQQFFASLDAAAEEHDRKLDQKLLEKARHELESLFDARHGGFGRAPKFPHPTNIERSLRHWDASRGTGEEDEKALHIALYTLEKMAEGGVYDQLGGGFYRYSVDDYWMIPHFEKMLYDNGPLLGLYADAWCITGKRLFKRVCLDTAGWVVREMQSPDGGYFSSLDADSQGQEGMFYRWKREQVRELLEEDEYSLFAAHYGLDQPPNFEGFWHLHTYLSESGLGNRFELPAAEVGVRLARARQRLFQARHKRVAPGRDDKVLTGWNALMIKGMARAGRRLNQHELVASAERALSFVHAVLWQNGRLLATYKDDIARLPAYLDDYAFLLDALLELLQTRWRIEDLIFAKRLADALLAHFRDEQRGGFFFTADDHEVLIHRPKPLADEATPSGNGVAAHALNRLGHLLGETPYIEAAASALDAAAAAVSQSSIAHASLLNAYEESLSPPEIVILRGSGDSLRDWANATARDYAARRLVFAIPNDAEALPIALSDKAAMGVTVAYICRGTTCSAPITDRDEYLAALRT